MGFGGGTRQLLAATGEFTAVIYTIVEYPSTWKEGTCTKQPEGVIENTFEMRFREKTRKGIARRQSDGCNSHPCPFSSQRVSRIFL